MVNNILIVNCVFAMQFVELLKGDLSHMRLQWTEMQMPKMFVRQEKLKSRKMKQLGNYKTPSFNYFGFFNFTCYSSSLNDMLNWCRRALPIAIAVGVVALAGLYFYLNSIF